jgi:TonB-dependent SusC/RagA subfamily outer membrane receptor
MIYTCSIINLKQPIMNLKQSDKCISINRWRSFTVYYLILILLLFIPAGLYAKENVQQNIEVKGTVTNAQGETLVGVNVVIQGTTTGTITDVDGNYSIMVPGEQSVLQFSYVGHQTRFITIGNQRVIDVQLSVDLAVLDEIIVVGYSRRRQSELSSSVAVVSEEQLRTSAAGTRQLNVMLQGRVPGLIVSGTSGAPGSSASMLIRGRGSIGAGTSPLTVVDGIIGGSYNPADVASVTILKDAAATGLYGSRAANGVIVITTKQGTPGEFRVSVNSTTGPTFDWDDRVAVHDANSLYELHSTAMRNLYDDRVAEGHPSFTGITFEQFRDGIIPPRVLDNPTDWHSLLTRGGYLNQHQVAMSGGYDRTRFYVSGTFNHERGTLLDQYDMRGDLRANVSHDISDQFTAHMRITGNYGQGPWWFGQ